MESKAHSDAVSRNTALSCTAAVLGLLRDGLGGRSLQSGERDPGTAAGGPGLGLRILIRYRTCQLLVHTVVLLCGWGW